MSCLLLFVSILLLTLYTAAGSEECVEPLVNTEIDTAFRQSGVVPDIIPYPPPRLLNASFETANVSLGNEIFPTRAVLMPYISYAADSKSLYTFIMLDADEPSRAAPVMRSLIIAIYVNIPGSKVNKGFSIVPYIPTTPYPGSRYHRYVLLVYKQCEEINIKNTQLINIGVYRRQFSVPKFVKDYGLVELIAGNFYVSEIPKNFPEFCYN